MLTSIITSGKLFDSCLSLYARAFTQMSKELSNSLRSWYKSIFFSHGHTHKLKNKLSLILQTVKIIANLLVTQMAQDQDQECRTHENRLDVIRKSFYKKLSPCTAGQYWRKWLRKKLEPAWLFGQENKCSVLRYLCSVLSTGLMVRAAELLTSEALGASPSPSAARGAVLCTAFLTPSNTSYKISEAPKENPILCNWTETTA